MRCYANTCPSASESLFQTCDWVHGQLEVQEGECVEASELIRPDILSRDSCWHMNGLPC